MLCLDESSALATRILETLGYEVKTNENAVIQRGRALSMPTAAHFRWHEVGHALAYSGDAEPRTPVENWWPQPAWIDARFWDDADSCADTCAEVAAEAFGVSVPGRTPAYARTCRERFTYLPAQVQERIRAACAEAQNNSKRY